MHEDRQGFSKYELADHIAVELARRYAEEFHEVFFVPIGRYPDADLISQSGKLKIEIKVECASARTGNVAVEYFNSSLGEASGLLKTRANFWLHVVPENGSFMCYEFDIDTLRKLVIEHGTSKDCVSNARCKIIPIETFRKCAKRSFPFKSKFLDEINAQAGV